MNNPWLPQKHRILNIIEETDLGSTFVVEFRDPQIQHGQSLQLFLSKIGEAPISVFSFTDFTAEFAVRRVGALTDALFDLHAGDDIYIRGPYGNGFPLEEFKGKYTAITVGGTDVFPARSTLHHYLNNPQDCRDVYVIAGSRGTQYALFENSLRQWWQARHFHTTLTFDHGEREGFQEGFTMSYVKDTPPQDFGEEYAVTIAGPLAMTKFTARECTKYGVAEDHICVSFKRKMFCVLGKYGHCKINETYACLEDPVSPYTKAKGLVDQEVNDMSQDMDINVLRTNCFRQPKVKGEYTLQMRIPGGLIQAKYLSFVEHLAETYGGGTFHSGSHQRSAIPGIKYENIDAVNKELKDYLEDVEIAQCGMKTEINTGFPTIGARNVMACIGGVRCIKVNINTQDMAKRAEREVFLSHYYIKTAIAGCPNDCARGHFSDFGVIGLTKPIYHNDLCIGCGSCVKACEFHATRALSLKNGKIEKDTCCCAGYGECTLVCPTNAMQQSPKPLYRVLIDGHIGKQYPRIGKTLADFLSEGAVLAILCNWQDFSVEVLKGQPRYLHGGHLTDMTGYGTFKELMLKKVKLNPEARVVENLYFAEAGYRGEIHVKPAK